MRMSFCMWSKIVTDEQVFKRAAGVHLLFIRPDLASREDRQRIVDFLRCAPLVSKTVVEKLIRWDDWRPRLLGFALAVRKKPEAFVNAIVVSLQNPRGLAIVPGCAAIVV